MPKVAIVCDWLTGIGGAERVVLELHHLFPEAPIYTSQYNPEKIDWFKDADVRVGRMRVLPAMLKKFLPVIRFNYFSNLDLSEYDLVISASGAEAKAVKTGPKAMHISYIHAPTHYYWARHNQYLKNPGFGLFNPVARLGLRLLVDRLRTRDFTAAQNPDYLLCNSEFTKREIKKFYDRDAVVIHPPVDVERFALPANPPKRKGFVIAGRQTPYKNFRMAVGVCNDLKLPLTVIGNGPEHEALVEMAGETITFEAEVSDAEMPKFFHKAEGFIFPNIDDFGIVAVEAMAAGTPVIALQAGGALDYVEPGVSGMFFAEPYATSLIETLKKFNSGNFKPQTVAAAALSYSPENFKQKILKFIEKHQK